MRTPNITDVIFGGPEPPLLDPVEDFVEASKLPRHLGPMEVPGVYMLESSPWTVEGTSRAGKRLEHRPSFPLPDSGAYRDGVGPGADLYYYEPQSHTLFQVGAATPTDIGSATPQEKPFENADAVFVISAFPLRSRFKYGIRATRFALTEAGHVAQNLLLGVLATGHVALPMGGFFDDELADLLGLDGVHEFPVYALLIGRPADVGALHGAGDETP